MKRAEFLRAVAAVVEVVDEQLDVVNDVVDATFGGEIEEDIREALGADENDRGTSTVEIARSICRQATESRLETRQHKAWMAIVAQHVNTAPDQSAVDAVKQLVSELERQRETVREVLKSSDQVSEDDKIRDLLRAKPGETTLEAAERAVEYARKLVHVQDTYDAELARVLKVGPGAAVPEARRIMAYVKQLEDKVKELGGT